MLIVKNIGAGQGNERTYKKLAESLCMLFARRDGAKIGDQIVIKFCTRVEVLTQSLVQILVTIGSGVLDGISQISHFTIDFFVVLKTCVMVVCVTVFAMVYSFEVFHFNHVQYNHSFVICLCI